VHRPKKPLLVTRTAPRRYCEKLAKAVLRAPSVQAFATKSCRPSVRAAVCRSEMRVGENAKRGSLGYQLVKQLQSFRRQLGY
jgi:hypothetical protein